jgi:hypothetical protein
VALKDLYERYFALTPFNISCALASVSAFANDVKNNKDKQ